MFTRRDAVRLATAGLSATALGVSTRHASATPTSIPSDTEWPMYGGNAARTRVMPGSGPTFSQAVIQTWSWQVGASIDVGSPPVVSQGTLLHTTGLQSGLIARDLATGAEHWRALQGRDILAYCVEDGMVYLVVDGQTLIAVDLASGASRWSIELPPVSWNTLTVEAGTLIVTTMYGDILAIDTESGTERWRQNLGEAQISLPIVGDSTVFVGNSEAELFALEAGTGLMKWQVQLPRSESMYSGGHGLFAESSLFFTASSGMLLALDAATGAVRWQTPADVTVRAEAMANGRLFVTESESPENFRVCALEASTGLVQWKTDQNVVNQVTGVCGDVLISHYGGGRDEQWYTLGLDVATGSMQWRLDTPYRTYDPIAVGPYLVMWGLSGSVWGNE